LETNSTVAPARIKIIPIRVLRGIDSFKIMKLRSGAKAGFMKNTMDAVDAEASAMARK
jgi:hypothetical protein